MTVSVDALQTELEGKRLPGGEIVVQAHEAAIGDQALRAEDDGGGVAHPFWFVVASLRGMGIGVEELCQLARQGAEDTLLLGSCTVEQEHPMLVNTRYRTDASIATVGSRTTRDGSRLDSVEVVVSLRDDADAAVGRITSTYLFKRGASA
jgi:hypothetical protein